ncbi:Proteasome component ECM29-like protein [Elsinoe fawcettii]|nr:Proteasome component ECM29-like protein [Elsinoe fawcettii]
MASEQSPEAKELSLIGKVELRIALADTDEKLQNTLKTYLAPLLLKLASPHATVRNKVISVCSHVNTRIKPDTIKLPVQALVEQFRAQNDVALIRHFDLSYIHKGVPRLSAVEKAELFPVIIKGIATSGRTSTEHASQVMNLVFQLIEYFTFPSRGTEEDAQLRTKLELSDEDTSYLASWSGKLILFVPVKKAQGQKPSCPGLTAEEYSFLALQDKGDTWTPGSGTGLNLTQTKAKVAKLLASGVFTDKERFFPALFASADPASAISDAGEDMMKRTVPNTDFEDDQIVRELFVYFFGQDGANGRQKARAPLRLKILGLLSKSLASTTFTIEIIKMVDEGLSTTNGNPDAMDIDPPSNFQAVQQISSQLSTSAGKSSKGGLEVAKFRAALFSYINFVARHGKQESLHAIAPRVLTRLRDFVEEQGWPKAASVTTQQELESRSYAYEVIGLLAKAGPPDLVIEPNLDVLRWLFRSLAYDKSSNSMIVSIEGALSTVLSAFSKEPLVEGTAEALEQLLLTQMQESAEAARDPESDRRSTRYVAVRFANRCLPFSSVRGRGIDLLAVGAGLNDRPEVIEEGQRGLSPYWYRMLNGSLSESESLVFPKFEEMMHFVFYELSYGGRIIADELDTKELVDHFRETQANVFADAILFCRLILLNEILNPGSSGSPTTESEWERKLNVSVDTDVDVRNKVREALKSNNSRYVELLLAAFVNPVTSKTPLPPSSSSAEVPDIFVDFCAILPDQLVGKIAPRYPLLVPNILSNNHALRTKSARAFGILASHPEVQQSDVQGQLLSLVEKVGIYANAVGAPANQVHGATLALAHYYSRHSLRTHSSLIEDSLFKTYFEHISEMLPTSNDKEMKKAAFTAVGELSLYQVVKPESFKDLEALKKIVDAVADFAKTGNEQAAIALGQIATILPEPTDATVFKPYSSTATETPALKDASDLLPHVFARLHGLHEIRTAESHFSVGEALTTLAVSWESTALATALDVPASPPQSPSRTGILHAILAQTLKDTTTTKPSLRKAAVIWLLCLVQFCGHLPPVQSQLPSCQQAFKRCLVDRDDLVQETASRGLGLVYEKGPASLRSDLVRDLMSSFSDSKKTTVSNLAGSVGDETQLFEPGALPTSGGESVSTYRDIMNLASEVGDSSLVYRFMSLAASNAVWSSRAAFGRFGLTNVLSGNGVEDYLAENPKVYISLYRYRFDPNEGVRRSMQGIWTALVKDSSKTIDAHFAGIMEDLLSNILGKEWRTRQACCSALADLIQGRPLDRYESYLERIWDRCFKVLDDIKESVRTAAASLARTLTGILTRTLEADATSNNAGKMLSHVLPFLLSPSGLESTAKEVQIFAVSSLLDIVKKASARALRPFIPDLVERLLGLIGSLEHEAVEYIRLNAKKYDVTEQKIDDMRLSSVRSSPVMEAIERCLDLLDEKTMGDLAPRIEGAMRSAIALPSKVACSRVLVTLATRGNFVFKPYADGFLKTLEKGVLDRNETVATSYASAMGYVARLGSDASILRVFTFARKLYFESEGDRDAAMPKRAVTSADIVKAVSKYATDRFNGLAAEVLPFVFVAKHDGNETVKGLYQDVWEDHVGGSRAVALYLREIIELAGQHLESPQWAVKHTSARAIAAAVVAIAGLGIDEAAGKVVWPPLEKALAAKTWDGKEKVLEAFVRFVEAGDKFWGTRDDVKATITKVAVREAKRQNAVYRKHAVPTLGKVALARKDVDMSDTVYDVVNPILEETLEKIKDDADAMDVDGGQGPGKSDLHQSILIGCVRAMTDAVNAPSVKQLGSARTSKIVRTLRCLAKVMDAKSEGAELGAGVAAAVKESTLVLVKAAESTATSAEGSEIAELQRRLA